MPPRQLVGAAATGQPEQERGAQLIAAARGSLPLRSVTQQRRGTKHQTPPRNHPPASQPASPEPNAPPKKTRGPGAISAALAAAAPAAAPPPPSPSPPPLPTEPLPFLVTNVEHDGVLWVWGRTEASGDAQSGTVGTWRRIPGGTILEQETPSHATRPPFLRGATCESSLPRRCEQRGGAYEVLARDASEGFDPEECRNG